MNLLQADDRLLQVDDNLLKADDSLSVYVETDNGAFTGVTACILIDATTVPRETTGNCNNTA